MTHFDKVKDMNVVELYEYLKSEFMKYAPCREGSCHATSGDVCPYCFITWLKQETDDG